MPEGAEWKIEHIEFLKNHWGKRSAAFIGSCISRTRNAVIGKAKRLNLERLRRVDVEFVPNKKPAQRVQHKKPHKYRVRLDD